MVYNYLKSRTELAITGEEVEVWLLLAWPGLAGCNLAGRADWRMLSPLSAREEFWVLVVVVWSLSSCLLMKTWRLET